MKSILILILLYVYIFALAAVDVVHPQLKVMAVVIGIIVSTIAIIKINNKK